MYKRGTVKVWRGFGENKRLNFIHILIKFSFTRGLLSEGLADAHSLAVFLSRRRPGPSCDARIHALRKGCTHVSARSSLPRSHTYDTNVLYI